MLRVEGSRLVTARMCRKMTQKALADKCGVSSQLISAIENNERQPDSGLLDRFVFTLGFPAKYFRGDEIDDIAPETVSFRARRSRISKTSRNFALGVARLAFNLLSRDLNTRFVMPKVQVPDLSIYAPEDAAGVLRSLWNLGSEPIGNVVHLLESKGVETYWVDEESDHLDAFSLWRDSKPFAILNKYKNAGDRSRFDAAHELAHLVLHQRVDDLTIAEVEKQANRFASAFLMPPMGFSDTCPPHPDFRALSKLKEHWGVSVQAMIMRGAELGIFSEWQKRTAFQQLTVLGIRKKEEWNFEVEESRIHRLVFESLARQDVRPHDYATKHLGIEYNLLAELMPLARYFDVPNDDSASTKRSERKSSRDHMRLI